MQTFQKFSFLTTQKFHQKFYQKFYQKFNPKDKYVKFIIISKYSISQLVIYVISFIYYVIYVIGAQTLIFCGQKGQKNAKKITVSYQKANRELSKK